MAKGLEGKGEVCCPPMWRKEVMWCETEGKGKMTKKMNRDDQLTATICKQALYSRLGPGSIQRPNTPVRWSAGAGAGTWHKARQISLEDSGGMRVHQQAMAKAQNQMYVL